METLAFAFEWGTVTLSERCLVVGGAGVPDTITAVCEVRLTGFASVRVRASAEAHHGWHRLAERAILGAHAHRHLFERERAPV